MLLKIKVPLHVSGIWIPRLTNDLKKSGSIGCGLNLELYVELVDYILDNCFIELNNKIVLRDHSNYICRNTGLNMGVRVSSIVDLGVGYGVSSASTLIHALASSIILKKDLSLIEYAKLAHEAEVLYKTGLADVISQYYGGVLIRIHPGAPGIGVVKNIDIQDNPVLLACILSGDETTPIMLSRVDQSVYKYGENLLKELIKNPSLESLFEKSQLFTRRVFDYKQVDDLMRNWISKTPGFYRKKQALIIWCEREWCSDLRDYLEKHGLKCFKTSINKGGFRIVYST